MAEGLQIISFNMRGFEANRHYLHNLTQNVDIVCIQEHWLHKYEKDKLSTVSDAHYTVIKHMMKVNLVQQPITEGKLVLQSY